MCSKAELAEQLLKAIPSGSYQEVAGLLDMGAPVDVEPGSDLRPPIHGAVCWRRHDIVKLLLERGADPDCRSDKDDKFGKPLVAAIHRGDFEMMLLLLHSGKPLEETLPRVARAYSPEYEDSVEHDFLFAYALSHLAVAPQQKYLVLCELEGRIFYPRTTRMLLASGIDMNIQAMWNDKEAPDLVLLIALEDYPQAIPNLLQSGALADYVSLLQGIPLLHGLASIENDEMLETVFDLRPWNANVRDASRGEMPLHAAATGRYRGAGRSPHVCAKSIRCLEILIAGGAQVDARDIYNRTPLCKALRLLPNPPNEFDNGWDYVCQGRVQALVKAGAKLDAKVGYSEQPLIDLAMERYKDDKVVLPFLEDLYR